MRFRLSRTTRAGLVISGCVLVSVPGIAQSGPGTPGEFRPATTEQKTRELRDLHEPSEAAGKRSIELSRRGPWLSAKTLEKSRTMTSRSASGGAGEASRRALRGPSESDLVAASVEHNPAPKDPFQHDEMLAATVRHLANLDPLPESGSTIFVGVGDAVGDPPEALLELLNKNGDAKSQSFVPAGRSLRIPGKAAKDPVSGESGPVIQLVEWSNSGHGSASVLATTRNRVGASRTRVFELVWDESGGWKVVGESDYRVGAR